MAHSRKPSCPKPIEKEEGLWGVYAKYSLKKKAIKKKRKKSGLRDGIPEESRDSCERKMTRGPFTSRKGKTFIGPRGSSPERNGQDGKKKAREFLFLSCKKQKKKKKKEKKKKKKNHKAAGGKESVLKKAQSIICRRSRVEF